MTTLALDTATPAPSLAIVGSSGIVERTLEPSHAAGRRVAEEVHLLLAEAGTPIGDVTRIVVGVGPGGFTGLRIGIATSQGLGQALGVPVVGVASIDALALGIARVVGEGPLVCPVIDAKRNEVFTGLYRLQAGALTGVAEPRAATVGDLGEMLARCDEPVFLGGDGLERCAELIAGQVRALPADSGAHRISAVVLEELSRTDRARPVTPIYLRLPDAEVNRLRREGATPGP